MRLLALATVTADGRPIVGPVDGIFFRGTFYFGSSPDSVRFRHLRNRPQVSATHLPGEELAVTVHGRAVPIDIHSDAGAELRQTLLEVYIPRYGRQWEEFLDSGPVGGRIVAETIIGMLQLDKSSYRNTGFRPSLPSRTPGTFTMTGLLRWEKVDPASRGQ